MYAILVDRRLCYLKDVSGCVRVFVESSLIHLKLSAICFQLWVICYLTFNMVYIVTIDVCCDFNCSTFDVFFNMY